MDVPLISDRSITPFRFWFAGMLHDGMQFQGELFRRLEGPTAQNLDSLYRLAMALQQRQVTTVITHSGTQQIAESCYTIWVNLRTTEPDPIQLDAASLSIECSAISSWLDVPVSSAGSVIELDSMHYPGLG